jgi:hypothetical protein
LAQNTFAQIIVQPDHVISLGDGEAVTVTMTVLSGGPVYFADFLQVSPTSNLGNLTVGNSQVFEELTWVVAAANSPATCLIVYLDGNGSLSVSVPYIATLTPPLGPDATTIDISTLTGPITINQPAGRPIDGQTIRFRFQQDGSGHAITFSGAYVFGSDVTSGLMPTTAGANFEILFSYHVNTGLYRALAISRGF